MRNKKGQFTSEGMKGNKHTLGKHWKIKDTSNMKGHASWKDKKHTEETKRKISERMKGKNNWNWKGGKTKKKIYSWNGVTTEIMKIRQSLEYKFWRKAVFVRDNFTCQKTGINGGKLRCHHINNFAQFPEFRFVIDNGITLSEKAHIEFHKLYGRKNNTREQLEEFLNS